jgi:hypothetical protein
MQKTELFREADELIDEKVDLEKTSTKTEGSLDL